MAETPKKFTQKVGYQNALDFDPVNGILKFGSYEMFAKDLGIKPQRSEFSFKDYLAAARPAGVASGMGASSIAPQAPLSPQEEKRLRAQFEADVQSGAFRANPQAGNVVSTSFGGIPSYAPKYEYSTTPPFSAGTVRNVQRLGPDTFAVDTYTIPSDQDTGYNLLNQISAKAAGMNVRRDDALLRQNKQDASLRRQGAGSTVLGGGNSAAGAAAKAINS